MISQIPPAPQTPSKEQVSQVPQITQITQITQISQYLKEKFKVFCLTDNLVFNNKLIEIKNENFRLIPTLSDSQKNSQESSPEKIITFIDGGQAQIISAGNFCLSFIRVFAQQMQGAKKLSCRKEEFYLLVTAKFKDGDIWYEGKVFGSPLVDEEDLKLCSNDPAVRMGRERAPIDSLAMMARRLAELSLAAQAGGNVVLDGTLEKIYPQEEKYLAKIPDASALAKTCSLFTTTGNSPAVLLNKLTSLPVWSYFVDGKTYFVKLNEKSRHVFRFEGDSEILSSLLKNCNDALFLGYPYGLILADKLARVSNAEKNSLMMNFLLRRENKEIADYLNSANAHGILDRLG